VSETCEACGLEDGYFHGAAECVAITTLRAELARVTAEKEQDDQAFESVAAEMTGRWLEERQRLLDKAATAERELAEAQRRMRGMADHHEAYVAERTRYIETVDARATHLASELVEARAQLRHVGGILGNEDAATMHHAATRLVGEATAARARVAELEAEARVVVEDQSAHSSLCEYLALDGSPCDCRLNGLAALVPPDVR
jgi:hypothetical protein